MLHVYAFSLILPLPLLQRIKTMSVSLQFADMSLSAPLAKAIAKMGFTNPTAIQEKAIPIISKGTDTISLAETGSGKTAAYLIPLISHLLENKEKHALILAPTRELATQIGSVIKEFTLFAPEINFAIIIGGAPMFKQIKQLERKPRIIVATPGRLVDHMRRGSANFKQLSHLILDEADRMFDMGFAPQVNEVVRRIPVQRQTLLFSATFPKEIRELAGRVLRNPVEIEISKTQLPPKVISQRMIAVGAANKNDRTLDLINAATGSVIVFTRTKRRTDRLARYLEEYGVKVTRIHGDRSQGQRNKSIDGFKSGLYRVMVATDIAARGLDISDISDVINYDLPMTTEDYVHRIGRTGRAGQNGQALTLVAPEEVHDWTQIARKMGLPLPENASKSKSRPNGHIHQHAHRRTDRRDNQRNNPRNDQRKWR